jgi:hypothetical protein
MSRRLSCISLSVGGLLLTASFVLAQAPIGSIAVKQFNDGTHWIVIEPVVYQIGNTKLQIEVPRGFVTDFASVPYGVTAFFLPTGQYSRAAVIHDYLYWTQACAREQADQIFLLAMIESDVPFRTRRTIYQTVRWKGEPSWLANQKERQAGLSRIIPEAFMKIGPLEVWSAYRQLLYGNGVRPEPPQPQPPVYCAADERDLR